jgi:aromatic-L-amino-acid/L-tryptophan decarboxylase
LIRDGALLRAAFELTPDYLSDARAADEETNFGDLGLQLTRTTRALKVWVSLQAFGLDAFGAAIEHSLELAEHAAKRIEASDALELVALPSLGIVCFRRIGVDNTALAAALETSGVGLVSSTRLHGQLALRLCILNHTTAREDVDAVLDFLETEEPPEPAAPPLPERHPDVSESLSQPPLFSELSPGDAERIVALGSEREAQPGETLIQQGDTEREFFVILDGTANVFVDGDHVGSLRRGEFFGELAALDWGAGYGYSRLATVVAGSPLRLLVFPEGKLGELMRFPGVEEWIRTAVHERLPQR